MIAAVAVALAVTLGSGAPTQAPAQAVSTATPTAPVETVHTTANHPWLTADRGWVEAGNLKLGEHVVTLSGATETVAWVHAVAGQADMYNLTVAHDHTYAVSNGHAVVHNVCPDDLYENPQKYAHERAQELQNVLPAGSQGRVTMGVGVVIEDGEPSVIVGTSEAGGRLRPTVRSMLSLQELSDRAMGNLHAEQNIVQAAWYRGAEVVAVGAGRPICEACEAAIIQAAGPDAIASTTRSGFTPYWMQSP